MKVIFYSHGGAGNHGCEALVRSTAKIIRKGIQGIESIRLFSYRSKDDERYGVDSVVDSIINLSYKRGTFKYYLNALLYKSGFKYVFIREQHRKLIESVNRGDVCVSVGGDNYTYDGWPELLAYVNRQLKKRGAKTVFWGCSISEELVKNETFLEDMRSFNLITVREPISYKLFVDAGIKENVVMVSDPAFELDITDYDIRQHFNNDKPVVGINLSPLIMSCETSNNATLNNYRALVQHLLDNTDYNILLVPHVVWEGNDDREVMTFIYDEFKCERLFCLPDMDCTQLKDAIGHCKFFVGARTHSTIAAYSQYIPTLVVGYSVKAKGIAESLFGTYKNYVLPVQELKEQDGLIKAFLWLEANEISIISTLKKEMAVYRQHCYDGVERLKQL